LTFCNRCGTTLTRTSESRPGGCVIMGGTFDDPNWFEPERHVWTRSAHHWMVIPQNVKSFEKGSSGG